VLLCSVLLFRRLSCLLPLGLGYPLFLRLGVFSFAINCPAADQPSWPLRAVIVGRCGVEGHAAMTPTAHEYYPEPVIDRQVGLWGEEWAPVVKRRLGAGGEHNRRNRRAGIESGHRPHSFVRRPNGQNGKRQA